MITGARCRFGDLKNNEAFIFASELDMPSAGMKTGLAIKVSPRRYYYYDDGMACVVGTINVEVLRRETPPDNTRPFSALAIGQEFYFKARFGLKAKRVSASRYSYIGYKSLKSTRMTARVIPLPFPQPESN